MNLNEFAQEYHLLKDKEGRYYKQDKNGEMEEIYLCIPTLSEILKISQTTLKRKIKNLTPIIGKRNLGQISAFYEINQVIIACSDFLNVRLLIPNKKGWVTKNGKKYASIRVIAEKLNISDETIKRHISNLTYLRGKSRTGQLVKYYNFEEVKSAFSYLLDKELLIADKNGWANKDGKEYASIKLLAKKFKLGLKAIKVRIKGLTPLRGKNKGAVSDFYCFEDAKSACADLLDDKLLTANKRGWAIIDGKKYAPITSIKLSISRETAKKYVKSLPTLKGISRGGQVTDFYCIEDVKFACANLLDKKLLIADKKGWAIKSGKKYAPLSLIAKKLKKSESTFRAYKYKLPTFKGKTRGGRITNFYCLEDAKAHCDDLLSKGILITDKNPKYNKVIKKNKKTSKIVVIIIDNKRHAVISEIAKGLHLAENTVRMRIKNLTPIKVVRQRHSKVTDFYNLEEVKIACADLLDGKLLIADENGLAFKDGQKYAPLWIIKNELGLSFLGLQPRITGLTSLKGKTRTGGITKFYNFEEVKLSCSDLLNDQILIVGKYGWAIKDNREYASVKQIAKKFGVSAQAIRLRIKNLLPIQGKTRAGITDLYSIDDVRGACTDLLIKKRKI